MENEGGWKWKAALAFLIGGLAGAAAGGYAGARIMMSYLGSEWLAKEARDIRMHVAVLESIRGGKQAEGLERLEASMDDDLISIEPNEYISDSTIAGIGQAIGGAKEYRARFPRSSNRKMVDKMVENVFSSWPRR